jgi:hypothetical protein
VDEKIARLEPAMRNCGPLLADVIADHGLMGAFGGEYVALTVGLLEVDRADTASRAPLYNGQQFPALST